MAKEQLFDEYGRVVKNFYIYIPGLDSKWASESRERDAQLYHKAKPTHTEHPPLSEIAQNEPSLAMAQNIDLPKGVEFRVDNNTLPNQPTVKNSSAAAVGAEKVSMS